MDRVISVILLVLIASLHAPSVFAQVYQWEYRNPNNPSLGKRESLRLAPGGATARLDFESGLHGLDLTRAYLAGADLAEFRVRSTILDDAYLADANLYKLQGDGLTARGADFLGADLRRAQLFKADLSGSSLRGTDLSSASMSRAVLSDADLTDANIQGARLSGTTLLGLTAQQLYSTASYGTGDLGAIEFHGDDLRGWDFSQVSLRGANLGATQLEGANFSEAHIKDAQLFRSNLTSEQLYSTASYQARELGLVNLSEMDLRGWDFSGVSMIQARFEYSDLSDAVFDGADLTNAALDRGYDEIVGTSFRKANLSNARLATNRGWRQIDFTGANLTNARVSRIADSTLDDAIIRGAELYWMTGADSILENIYSTASYKSGDMRDVVLAGNDLTGADFRGIDLSGADLFQANLENADLRGAVAADARFGSHHDHGRPLIGTQFDRAILHGARFHYRTMTDVSFRNADLSHAEFRNSVAGADLTDAIIFGISLADPTRTLRFTEQQLYSTASYKNRNLGPIQLKGDFQGWDFRGQDMNGASFQERSQLSGAMWEGANLTGASFIKSDMPDTDFRSVVLKEIEFRATDIPRADFRDSTLWRASFTGGAAVESRFDGAKWKNGHAVRVDFSGTSFVNADLRGTHFSGNNLSDVDFAQADIRRAGFLDDHDSRTLDFSQLKVTRSYQDSDLSGVQLKSVDTPNEDFSDFTMPRFEFKHGDMSRSDFSRANLAGAKFESADLSGVTFADADLTGAHFSNLQGIRSADFTNATVKGANFEGVIGFTPWALYTTKSYRERDLGSINLSSNVMANANFEGQDLTGAKFRNVDLTDARFSDAVITGATFSGPRVFGFTPPQLYSTRSYQEQNLKGVDFSELDLTGWDFASQDLTAAVFFCGNLTNAQFTDAVLEDANIMHAILTGADFTGADLTGANLSGAKGFSVTESTITRNMVWPNRSIRGFDLQAGETRVFEPMIKDYHVFDTFRVDEEATLTMSVISGRDVSMLIVSPEATVDLGGVFRIEYTANDYRSLRDRGNWPKHLRLFYWRTELEPDNRFDEVYVPVGTLWNLDELYTTGVAKFLKLGEWGDLVVDDELNAADIDLLSRLLTDEWMPTELEFFQLDLNVDGLLDGRDRQTWVEDLALTSFGDANLDGEVGLADFVAVSAHYGQAGGWSQGDFDGDGMVSWPDFVLLSHNYGVTSELAAVPEPSGAAFLLPIVLAVGSLRERRHPLGSRKSC